MYCTALVGAQLNNNSERFLSVAQIAQCSFASIVLAASTTNQERKIGSRFATEGPHRIRYSGTGKKDQIIFRDVSYT